MPTAIDLEPKYFRARGGVGGNPVVDREGGVFKAGIIHGVSVLTRGEAAGHNVWIDKDFLADTAIAVNNAKSGVKARFTHPGLSNDGVGSKLGVITAASVLDDQVFADLHFQKAAHKTPDGDLAEYVMTLAEETPQHFGMSIVFEHDGNAEKNHRQKYTDGDGDYVSPDERNTDNLQHAKLGRLRASDVVDDPAANPDGLFKRGQEYAAKADTLLDYCLGFSDAKPEPATCFGGVDAERASQFLTRYLERHNLHVTEKGGDSVSDEVATAENPPTRDEFNAELKRYCDSFGPEDGAVWFAEGVSYEDAQAKHIEKLKASNGVLAAKVEELSETLRSIDRGEDDGGDFGEPVTKEPAKFKNRIRISGKRYDDDN